MEKKSWKWTIRLAGDDWSLEWLSSMFTQGRYNIYRGDDGSYYLISADLAACKTADEAWEVATRIVDYINLAVKVEGPDCYDPVDLGSLTCIEPDGTSRHIVKMSGKAVGRARVRAVAGGDPKDHGPSRDERLAELLRREPPGSFVMEAVERWNLRPQTPGSLTTVLELIRDDIWGRHVEDKERANAWRAMRQKLAPAMGISERQLKDELIRCFKSLHDPATVGLLARHAGPRYVANPMSLDQARDFVHRLVQVWLRAKS